VITAVVAALREAGLDPLPVEVADALWLAAHLDARARGDGAPDRAAAAPPPAATQRESARRTKPRPPVADAPQDERDTAELHPLAADDASAAGGHAGTTFLTPAAPALTDALLLARSLRPLKRKVSSRREREIDEEATVQQVADGGPWLPVLRPTRERWLELALVVESCESTALWRSTIEEFRHLVERTGAFRDVRVWTLQAIPGMGLAIAPEAIPDQARHPRELVDMSGRRLIVVASDFTSSLWFNDEVRRVLAAWSAFCPTALLSLLPERLFSQTAIGPLTGRARASAPGSPSASLTPTRRGRMSRRRAPVPPLAVPVAAIEPRALANLAAMIAGAEGDVPAVFLSGAHPQPSIHLAEPAEQTDGRRAVELFRAAASPLAGELASYLAAAPLTLRIMRLVQSALLPHSGHVHLAEVFLSGLMRRVRDADDPQDVLYDFVGDTRDWLLNGVSVSGVLQVLEGVSEFISTKLDTPNRFLAVLRDPDGEGEIHLNEAERPFARVAARVLRRLGGRYARIAARLDSADRARRPLQAPRPLAIPVHKPPRNLPPRSGRFTGRESELTDLHERLSRSQAVGLAVHGHGGIGKTSLAIEYGWRHLAEYPGGVFFLTCESELPPPVAELAPHLGLESAETVEETAQRVKAHLKSGERCLLILDNVIEPEWRDRDHDWRQLPGQACRWLMTTRSEVLPGVEMYPLQRLTSEEGVRLLAGYRADVEANRPLVEAVVEWLDGLAVGLTVAGVYMAMHGQLTWGEYAARLDRKGLGAMRQTERAVGRLPEHDGRVDAVFDELLEALPAAQRRALEYAALLPEKKVYASWVAELLMNDVEVQIPALQGEEARRGEAVVSELLGSQLLRARGAEEHVVELHPVLRRRVRERLMESGRMEWLEERVLEISERHVDPDRPAVIQRDLGALEEVRDNQDLRPSIYVLAGTNGAGRTSIAGAALRRAGADYFSADEVSRSLMASNPSLTVEEADVMAWHEGKRLLELAIEERRHLAFMTTLSGNTIVALLERAADAGIDVRVWYAGLESPELHIARVRARVAKGGRGIPEGKIRERYNQSRLNLIRLLPQLTSLRLYDNSEEGDPATTGPAPKLILDYDEGRIQTVLPENEVPPWAKPIVDAALRPTADAPAGPSPPPAFRVTARTLNMRVSPGTEHRVVKQLLRDTWLEKLEESDGWARVRTADGEVGWVSARYLELAAEPPPAASELLRVTAINLNMRSEPGGEHPIVATLPEGTRLTRLEESSGWMKVKTAGGQEGWVSATYVMPESSTGAGGGMSIHIGVNSPARMRDLPLSQSESAARKMAELASQAGYGTTHVLCGADATRDAVGTQLANAARALRTGQTLFISFSGHGSRVPDLDGDERDGWDETWCLYDGDMLDDTFAEYLRLLRPGTRALVVIDSSYSGGMMRGSEGETAHYVLSDPPPDEPAWRGVKQFLQPVEPFIVPPINDNGIRASVLMLTATGEHQIAREGLFTSHLLAAWDGGRFRGSFVDLYRRVRERVLTETHVQAPQMLMLGAPDPSFPLEVAFHLDRPVMR
jgi:predicted ABC-type ATPase/SH3-like domain-containing protein